MQTTRLAFIGLGIMGKPMAGHLLAAGYPLIVHNRSKSKVDELLARGAKWADTPAAAAKEADVVFICVTDTPDVKAVLFADHGVATTARKGMVIVDHSTISPTETKKFATELALCGSQLLDAPVSG